MAKQRRGHQERPTGAHPRDTCRQFPAPGGLGPPLLAEPRLCPCLLSVVKRPKPAKTQLTGCPLAPPGSRWGRHMAQINAWVSHRECRTRARGWRGRPCAAAAGGSRTPRVWGTTGRAPRSTIFWPLRPTTAVQTTQRCYLCMPAAIAHPLAVGGVVHPTFVATFGPRPENDGNDTTGLQMGGIRPFWGRCGAPISESNPIPPLVQPVALGATAGVSKSLYSGVRGGSEHSVLLRPEERCQ